MSDALRRLGARALWLVPLCVGLAVRVYWTASVDAQPVHDSTRYLHFAEQLAAGEGYQVDGLPTAYWPVGYPAALSLAFRLFGSEPRAGELLNLLFAALTLIGIQVVGAKLARSALSGWLAALLFAFYPADIVFTGLLTSELQFNALAMVGTALALSSTRARVRLPLAGAVFGLAALTRAHGLLLPLLVAVFSHPQPLRGRRDVLVAAAWLYLGLSAVMAPWWARNARAFGAFVPVSTNGGINLWIGNNPHADGGYRYDEQVVAPLKAALPGRWHGGPREYAFHRVAGEMAREHMFAHPRATVTLWPRKLELLFGRDQTSVNWSKSVPRAQRPLVKKARAWTQPYYVGLWLLATLGAALAAARRLAPRSAPPAASLLPWLPLAVVATFSAVAVLYFGNARFHQPLMPWAAICAAVPLAAALAALAARATRSR